MIKRNDRAGPPVIRVPPLRRLPRRPVLGPFLRLGLLVLLLLTPPVTAIAQTSAPPTRAEAALAQALERGRTGDWAAAARTAEPAGALAASIVEWHRLRAGEGDWRAVQRFVAAHPGWPDLDTIHARAEPSLAGTAPPQAVVDFFAAFPPTTGAGVVALVASLGTLGRTAEAEAAARRAWTTMVLSAEQEQALRAAHGSALAALDAQRLDMLLWRHQRPGAERLAARMAGGWPALAAARLGLAARASGVDALIAAVPADLAGDPGLAFERFDWRMDRQLHESAGDLLLERSAAGTLGRPEAWARGRAFLARQALAEGTPRRAWALAAGHGLQEGASFADMEWFAGFVALRFLDEPATALGHFQRLRLGVGTPISLSRAGYWEGRAHEALGDPINAAAAYAFAAEHQTTFYGQLAAERAGLTMDPALAGTAAPAPLPAALADSEVLQAARMLRGAGQWHMARLFFMHAAATAPDAALPALAEWALALGEFNWSVRLARIEAARPADLVRAGFPLHPMAQARLPVPVELALAIARRESEFDPDVVSSANAQGLMQLLPGTGAQMAARLGRSFEERQLRGDPAFNVELGAAYLAQLIQDFGSSLALVAAGYNAGPGRPRRWIEDLGDPRRMDADALVDWVERVPFAETRSYIMRVSETLQVYRARRAGGPVPWTVIETLRGG
jgi:soluble lytic murein transglycosylase